MNFEEVPGKSESTFSVWKHFLRSKCKTFAQCKICQKVLKCAGGSTTGLQKHMKSLHKDQRTISSSSGTGLPQTNDPAIPSTSKDDTVQVPKKRTKLTDFFQSTSKPRTEKIVSRMVCFDGMPFRVFVTSEDLRQLFQIDGHSLPKSPNGIREMVLKESDKNKNELIAEIKEMLSRGDSFSISFDEWTSNRGRRYLSLNLHYGQSDREVTFRNLGLLRIHGTMTAEMAIEELGNKLQCFGMDIKRHIVAVITDGCSLMAKIGRLLNLYHQKCIAHAVQLAVIDVFYKKMPIPEENVSENIAEEENIDEDEDMTLADLSRLLQETQDCHSDSSDDDEDGVEFIQSERVNSTSPTVQSIFRYHDILAKVRKTVKIFNKSPKKNEEYLQKYVLEEFNKELQLLLDVKTRWSSVATMLSRFLMLKNCITKALIDLKVDVEFTQGEWVLLKELHEVLDTVKTTVESLCQRDATLLTADIGVKYALKTLDNMNTNLSKEMSKTLQKRYKERRLLEASIMQYLTNTDTYFSSMPNEDLSIFVRPDGREMLDKIVALLLRLSQDQECAPDSETNVPGLPGVSRQAVVQTEHNQFQIYTCQAVALSKKDELQFGIQKALAKPMPANNKDHDLTTIVRVEMALWENGGERGHYLTLAYKYLSSISPTSVEPERVFSSAGYICNRLRTRLSDRSLDAISYLRTYYQQRRAQQYRK